MYVCIVAYLHAVANFLHRPWFSMYPLRLSFSMYFTPRIGVADIAEAERNGMVYAPGRYYDTVHLSYRSAP